MQCSGFSSSRGGWLHRLPGSVHGTGEQCSPSQFTKSHCILSMSGAERHQWEFDTMSVLMGLGEEYLAILHFRLRLRRTLNALGLTPTLSVRRVRHTAGLTPQCFSA